VTTAPREDQLRLLDLQEIDTRIHQLQHAKKTHATLARIADLQRQLADLHGSLVDSRTAAEDLRTELRKAEADVAQVVARQARNRDLVESGTLSAKDAQGVAEEVALLTRRRDVLEEAELDVMERLEAHEVALGKVEAANEQLTMARTAAEAERDTAFEEINAEGRALTVRRRDLAAVIDPALIAHYDQLRTRLGGAGAAALRLGRCGGCGIVIPPGDMAAAEAAPPDQIIHCEECGRILVRVVDS
jgi:predicted  nucleic acid-binding Zn-ribbon protein